MDREITEDDLHAVLENSGEDAIRRVAAAFYERVPDDPVLGPMYPADDLDGAETRLADFLVFRLGGAKTYLETRGHPRLRMRHAPFAVDSRARDHWMRHMTAAVEIHVERARDREVLLAFLGHVADFLRNRPG